MLNYDYKQSDLSRSVLGGLFSGIVATVLNMIFVYAYRFISDFEDFQGFDLTVIVFGTLLLSLACGVVFYLFVHYMKRGVTAYRIAVFIITLLIIYLGLTLRQSIRGEVPMDFRIIVVITQVVIGGLAAFLIPYLFRHDSLIS
jgi:magnesium-transporting ATPase (P-type)